MPPSDDSGEWIEYRLLILKTLEDVQTKLTHLEQRLDVLDDKLKDLTTKATIWGGLVGGVVGLISTIGGFIVSFFQSG